MKLKRLSVFVLIIILLGILSIYYDSISNKITKENEYDFEEAFVIEIIDGDTIIVMINDSKVEIRFLGINTPEKGKAYYEEAKDFLKEIENKSVRLLRDFENLDRYNRSLRYVFYNNKIMNVEILQEGFGTSFMVNGLKYENKLKNAEKFAIDNKIRLWKKSENKCSKCIELVELNFKDEFFDLKNNCDFDCDLSKWEVKDDANHFIKLEKLGSNELKRFNSNGKIWNNDGDRFFMKDDKGYLVIFYEY